MNKQKLDGKYSLSGMLKSSLNDENKVASLGKHDSANSTKGQTLCGDFNIEIDHEGVWHYLGSPIGRKELVKLFASVLEKDGEGNYWLITPAEKGTIAVADVPFQAIEMTVQGEYDRQVLKFRTNIDEIVIADQSHPIRIEINPETEEPSPYIMVRDGLEARMTRAVFYQLVDLGQEKALEANEQHGKYDRQFGVWSSGQFFQIGTITDQD